MRRKPKDLPHLRDTNVAPEKKPTVKRQGILPHQNRFSVQDVRDYSTPQGAAMANEEMRRLRNRIDEIVEKKEEPKTAEPAVITPIEKEKPVTIESDWALTTKHNGVVVPTAKIIQALNFQDRPTGEYEKTDVVFELSPASLQQELMYLGSNKTVNYRQTNISAYAKRKVKSGIITINTLPDTSEEYHIRDEWKRAGRYYTPDYGHYGWYVYNYIDHGYLLNNPNDYILSLVDLHQIVIDDIADELLKEDVMDWLTITETDMTDAEEVRSRIYDYYHSLYAAQHQLETQVFIPEHEGLRIETLVDGQVQPKDIVIIRAVYKPDLPNYFGHPYTRDNIEYIDETHIRTNIIYHYMIEVK